MNDLWAARRAENKVEQLRLAHSIGFDVPETIVTNSLTEALSLGDSASLIVKSIASAYFELTDEAFVYTRKLDSNVVEEAVRWNAQPLVVQRMIDGLDVRVIMVEDQGFGAYCKACRTDWRLAPGSVEWRPWIIPQDLTQLCRSYMGKFGLRFAAFDFIFDGRKAWFLEANQAGEWAFIDRPLSLGIAEAIASSLISMATRGG
jgi:glutathione synthase/RimK-type ligase-like ATP-grasp enzyme